MKKIEPPFIRNPYNYDTLQASDDAGLDTGTEGGAKQSFKDECDINTIVKRFGLGYELPQNTRIPQYGDFLDHDGNFHKMMNTVRQTQEMFDALPAEIRTRFNNDPRAYVDFCVDEKNRGALADMGYLSKEALERFRMSQDELKAAQEAEIIAKHEASKDATIPPEGGSRGQKTPPRSDKKA